MIRYVGLLLRRVALTAVVGALVWLTPLPVNTPEWLVDLQVPLAITLVVCFLGKTLYDTFFYDRYWP